MKASTNVRVWTIIAWTATALILTTYGWSAVGGPILLFNWANAVGGIPIMVIQHRAKVWPALALTAAFTTIGAVGLAVHYL